MNINEITEVEGWSGWYTSPYLPFYYINKFPENKEGEIWSVKSQKLLKFDYNDGYPRVTLYEGNGNSKKYFVHKLYGMFFIPLPTHFNNYNDDNLTINHIDHNRCNNSIDNLEWVSRKENTIESWDNGYQDLHKKSIRFIDLETKKDVVFQSVSDCSREINVPVSTILNNVNKNINELTAIYDKYLFCYIDDKIKMSLFDNDDKLTKTIIKRRRNNTPKPISSYDLITEIIDNYSSKLEASKILNCSDCSIKDVLGENGNEMPKLVKGRYIFGITDSSIWKDFLLNKSKFLSLIKRSPHLVNGFKSFLSRFCFCFKGEFRKDINEYKRKLIEIGAKVSEELSNDVNYLIIGDMSPTDIFIDYYEKYKSRSLVKREQLIDFLLTKIK